MNLIKNYIKTILGNFIYCFYKYSFLKSKYKIYSIDETIKMLCETNNSIVRFGDGELALIRGFDISFQKYSEGIKEDLIKVINSNIPIAIPNVFQSLEMYNKETKKYWKTDLVTSRKNYYKLFSSDKEYYDAFISRLYMPFLDKSSTQKWYECIKKIWDKKNILIIEGEKSRLGVGNDLFSNAESIKRILCPSENSYAKKEIILETILSKYNKELVLVSLGPTAKIIVHALFENEIRAIDIGHIDIEYEWYIRKTKSKIPIETKYTNEANQDMILEINDVRYNKEIIANLSK